jgi:antitoxin MazE
MQTQIGKWEHSLTIRIPDAYARDLGLTEGMVLELSLVDGGLLFRPGRKRHTLEELVSGITPENRHQETDWGPPVGCEAW